MVVTRKSNALDLLNENNIKEALGPANRTQVLMINTNAFLPLVLHVFVVSVIIIKHNIRKVKGLIPKRAIFKCPNGWLTRKRLLPCNRRFRKRDFYLQTSTVGITLHISKMLYTQDK